MRDSSSPQVPRGCHSGGFRAVSVAEVFRTFAPPSMQYKGEGRRQTPARLSFAPCAGLPPCRARTGTARARRGCGARAAPAALTPLPGQRGLLGAVATCGWADPPLEKLDPRRCQGQGGSVPSRPVRPLAATGGVLGPLLPRGGQCSLIAPLHRPRGRGAGAAAPALFQGGQRCSTPGPARSLHPRSPASLRSSPGMAEPGRPGPAAGGEAAADEFRDVIRSRSGRHRSLLPAPGRAGVPAQPPRGKRDPALGSFSSQCFAKLLFFISRTFPFAVRHGRGSPAARWANRASRRDGRDARVRPQQMSVAVRVPADVPYLGLCLCRLCWRACC